MRKLLSVLFMGVCSQSVFALPMPAKFILKGVLENPQFSQLLDQKANTAVQVNVIPANQEVAAYCQEYSRSASFALVQFDSGFAAYFSTPMTPDKLKLCQADKILNNNDE